MRTKLLLLSLVIALTSTASYAEPYQADSRVGSIYLPYSSWQRDQMQFMHGRAALYDENLQRAKRASRRLWHMNGVLGSQLSINADSHHLLEWRIPISF